MTYDSGYITGSTRGPGTGAGDTPNEAPVKGRGGGYSSFMKHAARRHGAGSQEDQIIQTAVELADAR